MGRRNRIVAGLAVLVIALVPAAVSVAVGSVGREQVIQLQRSGCARTSMRNAAITNVWRAQYVANKANAQDPGASPRTRAARTAELPQIAAGISLFDAQIDRSDWRLLHAGVDRLAVRHSAFTCASAYPATSLLP